ncbi:uncharacterized protein LOC107992432 [Apis cerana]|uniref:uncharacterized protein LOC107992432 n=1 Tax=Apis cerana TaxID=7461 RepID=UPI0007E2DA56|nr:uncharacterized protein LOC107992432 [Apis cerana]
MKNKFFSLKLMIFISLILDSMIQSAVINSDNHHRIVGRITLSDAVKASKTFICKKPQFRAYSLKDLMQNVHQNPGESPIQPVYIVLKRCDGHSGCCASPLMSCSPVESAIYYEEIEIEVWSLETNNNRRQWIRVEQHDKCSCEITTINDRFQLEHLQPNVTLI